MADTDLDGGRPMPKNWVKESDQLTKEMNNDKEDSKTNVVPIKSRQKST